MAPQPSDHRATPTLLRAAIAFVWLVACEGGDGAGERDKGAVDTRRSAELTSADPSPWVAANSEAVDEVALAAGTTAAAPDPAVSVQDKRAARRTVNAARTLSRQGDLEAALRGFEEAMALDPLSATAACEAGFAALRQERLEHAARLLERGLGLVTTPKQEAACRYNLGLVQDKRGETARALRQYKRSLELRPSKAAQRRIAKLSPDGRCLPPVRVLDLHREFCGLPDDYAHCGLDENGVPLEDDLGLEFTGSDSRPLSNGSILRAAGSPFVGSRMRVDLLLDDHGELSLLAELGWTVHTDVEETLDEVRFTYQDLIPGGPEEVVVVVRSTLDDEMSEANWVECEDKVGEGGDFDACLEAAYSGPVHRTGYVGCGVLDGRWVCGRSEAPLTNEAEFMALFECG